MKTKQINVWNQLALNHLLKDIDHNFLKTFDALLFLSPPRLEDLKENFTANRLLGVNETTLRFNPAPEKVVKSLTYNFNDFLINKLIENFRRIYAVTNSSKKDDVSIYAYIPRKKGLNIERALMDYEINPKNLAGIRNDQAKAPLEELMEQQNNIYYIYSQLYNKMSYNIQETIYPKAVIGKHYKWTSFEMLCYLGLHSSLSKGNYDTHLRWIKNASIIFKEQNLDKKNITLFSQLHYDENQKEYLLCYLDKFSPKAILEKITHLDYLNKPHAKFIIVLIDHFAKNPNLIKEDEKIIILEQAIRLKSFAHVPTSSYENFEKKLDILFEGCNLSSFTDKKKLKSYNHDRLDYKWLVDRLNSSEDVNFLLGICLDKNINDLDRQKALSLFNLNDSELLKNTIDIFSSHSNAVDKLKAILPYFDNAINNDSLSYIISKNSHFFEVVKPYYLMEKLAPLILNENINPKNKRKI